MAPKIAPAPPGATVKPRPGWLPDEPAGVVFGRVTDDPAGVLPTVSAGPSDVIGDDVVAPMDVEQHLEPEPIEPEVEPAIDPIEPEPAIDTIVHDPVIVYAVDRSRKIKLQSPIIVDGRQINVIALRPVTIGDVVAWHGGEIGGPIAFLSRLSGEPVQVIEAIQYPDAGKLMETFLAGLPAFVAAEMTGTAAE